MNIQFVKKQIKLLTHTSLQQVNVEAFNVGNSFFEKQNTILERLTPPPPPPPPPRKKNNNTPTHIPSKDCAPPPLGTGLEKSPPYGDDVDCAQQYGCGRILTELCARVWCSTWCYSALASYGDICDCTCVFELIGFVTEWRDVSVCFAWFCHSAAWSRRQYGAT